MSVTLIYHQQKRSMARISNSAQLTRNRGILARKGKNENAGKRHEPLRKAKIAKRHNQYGA